MSKVAILAGAAAFAVAGAAYAGQIDGHVTANWGDWLAGVLRENAGWISASLTAAIIHFAPGGTGDLIRMFRINQVLEKAVAAGINKTAGAVQGKSLSADVGNKVIEQALEYALDKAPLLLKKIPLDKLRDMVVARLNLDAGTSAASLTR